MLAAKSQDYDSDQCDSHTDQFLNRRKMGEDKEFKQDNQNRIGTGDGRGGAARSLADRQFDEQHAQSQGYAGQNGPENQNRLFHAGKSTMSDQAV